MQHINEFGQPLDNLVENWTSRARPADALTGRYCRLEKLNIERHASELFASLSHNNPGDSWTYLPYGPFTTLNDFQDWLAKITTDPDICLYAIINNNSKPVGAAAFMRINPDHGVIEIGHVHFSRLLKQTALATEAIYLMIRHVFDDLGYRRCEWKCHSLNAASIAAAKRFGFTFEGIFRHYGVFKNRNRDTAWFSIIDPEWPALRTRFQTWLEPNNFDISGKQIRKLSEIVK